MTGSSPEIFRYHGKSMWPCFQEGDLLQVKPVGLNPLRKGDCIVWEDAAGRRIVHRVICTRGELRTRGDAMVREDCFDGYVPMIIGRVIRRCRLGRWSRVAGGFSGSWAGIFYHYAGRIDPARNARGGQLARFVRAMIWPLGRILLRRQDTPEGDGRRNETVATWSIASRVVVMETRCREIPWPWRLALKNDTE